MCAYIYPASRARACLHANASTEHTAPSHPVLVEVGPSSDRARSPGEGCPRVLPSRSLARCPRARAARGRPSNVGLCAAARRGERDQHTSRASVRTQARLPVPPWQTFAKPATAWRGCGAHARSHVRIDRRAQGHATHAAGVAPPEYGTGRRRERRGRLHTSTSNVIIVPTNRRSHTAIRHRQSGY